MGQDQAPHRPATCAGRDTSISTTARESEALDYPQLPVVWLGKQHTLLRQGAGSPKEKFWCWEHGPALPAHTKANSRAARSSFRRECLRRTRAREKGGTNKNKSQKKKSQQENVFTELSKL